ncbi:hypothetical protein [Actinophytocola sediminis]
MTAATAPHAPHPLEELVPDPTDLTPVCDEPQFATMLAEMVADDAPRLFAIVQEYGERVDATIAAWGLAFADRAEISSATGSLHMNLRAPEHALPGFSIGSRIRARLVWFDPNAASPTEPDDDTD